MKSLLKSPLFKSCWILTRPHQPFYGHPRFLSSPIFAQYEAVSQGKQPVPEYFNFANDVLDKWSQLEKDGRRPSNPALWWINGRGGEVRWSFEELGLLSRKVANILSDQCGLQKGDRILAILPRIPEWWLVTVACIRTGITIIPGTTQLTAKDIQYRLQVSKAKCIITTDALAPAVDFVTAENRDLQAKLMVTSEGKRDGWLNFNELLKEAPADYINVQTKIQDPMVVYFTSGTTGPPKMAELSQGSMGFRPIINQRCWLDLTPLDIMWCTADTGWVLNSLGAVFDPWVLGSCVFVHNLPQVESTTILNTLSRFPITTILGAPTLFRMLVQNDLSSYKFMSLRHCVSAGEPLNPEVMEKWKKKTGLDIYEAYGQTETGMICVVRRGMKIKPGSMGKACAPYDVQIVDEETNILPPGKEGEIAIKVEPERPLGLFSRYIDNPGKTAATVRGGFHITGDRGVMDKEGYFWFVGRADDIINSSGYRIGPFEVESALLEHPAVAEAAAISSPDPLRGEVVKAFVVLSPGYMSQDKEKLIHELQEHVKKVTAPYKYPRKMEFVQQLPKTITGKIKRNELRNKEWGRV
ncbi:acyl-coenzyme A synthetase ACSM3, mitochondrial-like [Sceloporus undulatus]|uniref:acyl-coenzyme A synthetase ACSM3, mitochondrial-like n=1 Tax=Sceloporus undulatus TaxID=8520 RepID=UPI001C4D4D7F|nr:acyl-coenzyme A synthetase ACSM3, mitochondrial-like [Sceloporus undulatus]